jgi:hypothetical protein
MLETLEIVPARFDLRSRAQNDVAVGPGCRLAIASAVETAVHNRGVALLCIAGKGITVCWFGHIGEDVVVNGNGQVVLFAKLAKRRFDALSISEPLSTASSPIS